MSKKLQGSTIGLMLLDRLFTAPLLTVKTVAEVIERTYPIANGLVADFVRLGLLKEITGRARNRVFRYEPYLEIFGELRP